MNDDLSLLLERMKLEHLDTQLDTLCEDAAKHELDYRSFLTQALATEWRGRQLRGIEARLKQARLPWIKTLDQFDFDFQPSIDRKLIRELASGAFVERAHNVVLLGPPGVGKTHLAVGLGVKAVEAGYSALFLTLEVLMTRLTRARHENRLERTLQQLSYPKLLILDEIGYLPLSREDASLFFRLLSRRYERGSLIVTSNKGFIDWGEVFSDPVLATAILDRLLHQSVTINIKGDSYRLKEKRRAGLLGRAMPQQADAEMQQQKEVA
jgi:DNA replication protein DnaC